MIDYADKDRDGRISFEEFVEVITKEYPQVWSKINKWVKTRKEDKSRKIEKNVYEILSIYLT